jgi:hypothetical protein
MPRPEDTLDRLARIARDDEALHAASERRPVAWSSGEDSAPSSTLPESLTRPISRVQQSSLVDAIQARLASRERHTATTATPPTSRARRRPNALALAGLVALAAAVALLMLGKRPDAETPLSRYEVQVVGSVQSERGNTQALGTLRLRPSTQLRFELRPMRDEHGSVRARAFVRGLATSGASETRELLLVQQQSAAGALRVQAQLLTPLPERGELLLYVGRPSTLDRTPQKTGAESPPGPGDAQEFRFQFERSP